MAVEILTLALVVVTGYYAWHTQRMAREMRRARGVAVLPHLVPTLKTIGGGSGFLQISNVGVGPALDVDVHLRLEPNGDSRHWKEKVVPPGASHDFVPRPDLQDGGFDLDQLTADFYFVRLTGTYADALGDRHEVDSVLPIREVWSHRKTAKELSRRDFRQEVMRRLEGLDKSLAKLASEIPGYFRWPPRR